MHSGMVTLRQTRDSHTQYLQDDTYNECTCIGYMLRLISELLRFHAFNTVETMLLHSRKTCLIKQTNVLVKLAIFAQL